MVRRTDAGNGKQVATSVFLLSSRRKLRSPDLVVEICETSQQREELERQTV
jgi:hypothetical protein